MHNEKELLICCPLKIPIVELAHEICISPMRSRPSSAPSWTTKELTESIPRTCLTSLTEKSLLNPQVFLMSSAICNCLLCWAGDWFSLWSINIVTNLESFYLVYNFYSKQKVPNNFLYLFSCKSDSRLRIFHPFICLFVLNGISIKIQSTLIINQL